jgi:hypothetical protein
LVTTIAEAIAEMGLEPDDEHGERAIVYRSPQTGKLIHSTLREMGDRKLEDLKTDAWLTGGKYKEGKIHPGGGRTAENATRAERLLFDVDLKDYLGLPPDELHGMPHEELDRCLNSLMTDAREVFARCKVPIHQIVCTGYGLGIHTVIHTDDRHRKDDIDHANKRLVERINGTYGGKIVDAGVNDPLTRLTRLVGTFNHKGPLPRSICILWEQPGCVHLDDLKIEAAAPRRESRPDVPEDALDADTLDTIVSALNNEYVEGTRNYVVLGVPALMAKAGVPMTQALEVIGRVAADDEEIEDRLKAVERTYERWEAGQSISGYHALGNCLSRETLDLLDTLLNQHKAEVRAASSFPYEATPSGIVFKNQTRNGIVDVPLCNFVARITEERKVDDGAEVESRLVIDGQLAGGRMLPPAEIPIRQFSTMNWVLEQWGTRAIISAGFSAKERIREAIQKMSPDCLSRYVYGHPGWRHIDGTGWVFLHAGGAIGAEGAVSGPDVVLQGVVKNLTLPEPPAGAERRAAVRASLDLLDLAPDTVMAPLMGAVYRAPLIEMFPTDLTVFLLGPSGAYKSELSALAMQHFGAEFNRMQLPAQWTSTENALERIGFDFKDAV